MDDTLTFQIINALQIHPRISWSRLGQILHTDPSTVSRRWSRLVDEALVWTSCYESTGTRGTSGTEISAFVEIRCQAGRRAVVVEALNQQRSVLSVNYTSGSRDIYIMITAKTLPDMDRFVDEQISSINGVMSTQTHFLRKIYFESSYWRLKFLTPEQINALEQHRPDPHSSRPRLEHQDVIVALSGDIRRTAAGIRKETGRSINSVARIVDSLLGSEWMRWRIDFAQSVMGWSAGAVLWMNVPQPILDDVAESLRSIQNVRMCASVTGPSNLALSLWLHDLQELDKIEEVIVASFPRVVISDRWIVPSATKRGGYLLDESGKRMSQTPVDWGLIFSD